MQLTLVTPGSVRPRRRTRCRFLVSACCAGALLGTSAKPAQATVILPNPQLKQDFGLIVGAIALGIVAIGGAVAYKIVTADDVKKKNKIDIDKKGLHLENNLDLKQTPGKKTSFNNSVSTPDGLATVSEDYSFDTTGQVSANLDTSFTAFADVVGMSHNSGERADFSGDVSTGFELAPQVAGQPGTLELNLDISNLLLRVAAVSQTAAQAGFSLGVTSPQLGTLFTSDAMLFGAGGLSFVSSGDISPGEFGDFMSGNDVGKTLTDFVLNRTFNLPADEPIDISITLMQSGFSAVPEPSGMALLLAGLCGLACLRRKRLTCQLADIAEPA